MDHHRSPCNCGLCLTIYGSAYARARTPLSTARKGSGRTSARRSSFLHAQMRLLRWRLQQDLKDALRLLEWRNKGTCDNRSASALTSSKRRSLVS